ncbi:MAG: CoA transferase, partial [Burkholderiales bacterium]
QAKRNLPFSTEKIKWLLETAEQRIGERAYDPAYAVRENDEAYQRNWAEWDREYAGRYIAIFRGQVVDSDLVKPKLVERIINAQRGGALFRAYIVKVGNSGSKARLHNTTLQGKMHRGIEGDFTETPETDRQLIGWMTFRRELPRLLQQAPNHWVAFHGEHQVALGASKRETYEQFRKFCDVAGCTELAEDPRFSRNDSRVRHRETLVPILSAIIKQRSRDDWVTSLEAAGVPCGPINTIEQVFDDPQVKHRGMKFDMPHPLAGQVPLVANPMRLSGTPVEYRKAPPTLGEDTDAVMSRVLGLSTEKIGSLRKSKIL